MYGFLAILLNNESCQLFMNICAPKFAHFTIILQKNWGKMIVKKLVLPNYID
jgi:hypothetical protein